MTKRPILHGSESLIFVLLFQRLQFYDVIVVANKLARTRVTNGKAMFLDGVDGRTLAARRYRDLFNSFVSDIGGMEIASEAQLQLARRCAAMCCQAELIRRTSLPVSIWIWTAISAWWVRSHVPCRAWALSAGPGIWAT